MKGIGPPGLGGSGMFTHRYIVLGVTEGGYVDRLAGIRGTDPREICERALEKVTKEGKNEAYKQLILLSVGRDGEVGGSLNVRMNRIEPTPPIPQPTYTLQPVQAYFG